MRYLILSLCLLSLTATSHAQQPLPRLRAEGNRLVDPQGNTVVLRGVSLPYLSQKRDRSVNERIDMATDTSQGWYAKVIRLPLFGPHRSLDPNQADEAYIRAAVEHCTQRGVYCIIDLHFIDDLAKRLPHTHYFWYHIAQRYKDHPNVIFELYNEDSYRNQESPRTWSQTKRMITPIAQMVRERAPDTLLLVSTPEWSHVFDGIIEDPMEIDNIAYVAHIYPRHPRKAWDDAAALAKHHPVFVTEFGWQQEGGTGSKVTRGTTREFGLPFLKFMEAHGMSYTAFTFDNEHGPSMFDKEWNLLGGEDYCGQTIKQWLADHQNAHTSAPPASTSPAP